MSEKQQVSYDIDRRALGWQWRILHSIWLLPVILGFGALSFIGFFYCALRVRSRRWYMIAAVVGALTAISWVLLATFPSTGDEATIGGTYTAVLWLALIVLGFVVNRDYLTWRAKQVRPQAPPAPAREQTSIQQQIASPEQVTELEPAHNTASVAAPADSATPTAAAAPLIADSPREAGGDSGAPVDAVEWGPGADAVEEANTTEPEAATVSTWQQAEALAAWHMTKLGFTDASLTASGADGGIDVRASDAVAQVKHYAQPVGAPAIQQLRGAAHGHDFALFYAQSGYTKAALEYADAAEVALFSYDSGGHVEPMNMPARLLQRSAGGPDGIDAKEFELKVKAQRLGQELFDKVTSEFFEVAHEAIAAANGDPRSPILASARTELRRVEQTVHYFGRGSIPIEEFMDEADKIIDATDRLRDDLARLG